MHSAFLTVLPLTFQYEDSISFVLSTALILFLLTISVITALSPITGTYSLVPVLIWILLLDASG